MILSSLLSLGARRFSELDFYLILTPDTCVRRVVSLSFIRYNMNMKKLVLIVIVLFALGACANRSGEEVIDSFVSDFANAVSGAPDRIRDGMKVRHLSDTQEDPEQNDRESE